MACIGDDFAYLAIPRTASRAITVWLLENFRGNKTRPEERGFRDLHCKFPPQPGKCVFTCVRNPLSRLVSFWRHCNTGRPLLEWLEKAAMAKRNGYKNDLFYRNQTEFIEGYDNIHIVRFEDLPGSLWELPFVNGQRPPFPETMKHETRSHTGYLHLFGRRELELALEHSGDDFDRFGYTAGYAMKV